MRLALAFLLVLSLCGASGQVIRPGTSAAQASSGPVSILITAPQMGAGLGPKVDVGEEFDLAFELQLANLTLTNVTLEVMFYDGENQTYVALDPGWIVGRVNASWQVLSGPSNAAGLFKIRIPERGYYFLKLKGTFKLDGRDGYVEAGDLAFGPRIRVIPSLTRRSYLVIVGMPVLPLATGLVVRSMRRKVTKRRRQRPEPGWLQRLREQGSGDEKDVG